MSVGFPVPTPGIDPALGDEGSGSGGGGAEGSIVDADGPVTITKIWSGSQAQYDGLGSYDADTLYFTPEA